MNSSVVLSSQLDLKPIRYFPNSLRDSVPSSGSGASKGHAWCESGRGAQRGCSRMSERERSVEEVRGEPGHVDHWKDFGSERTDATEILRAALGQPKCDLIHAYYC